MRKQPTLILLIFLVILIVFFSVNCTFDPGGCRSSGRFAGCFESSQFGGSVIRLQSTCESLAGILTLGPANSPNAKVYSFSGETITFPSNSETGVAELFVTLATNSNQTDRITALLGTNDTMRLIFENEAPVGPMSRCVSQ